MLEGPRPRVLCVGPGGDALAEIQRDLEGAGYAVSQAKDKDAMRALRAGEPQLLLVHSGDEGGAWEMILAAAKDLRGEGGFIPVLVLVPGSDVQRRVRALRLGADESMDVPADPDELLARVEALLRIKSIQDRMAKSRRDLQRMSTSDGLTGLLNHRHLQERCREELLRAQRYHDPLSVMTVDLDDFEAINAEHGEDAGNDVLRTVARLLTDAVREVDIAGRVGGDTFCLVLPNTHLTGSLAVAERAWGSIRTHGFPSVPRLERVTCSIGLAFFPAKGVRSYDDLMGLSQEALLRAKREGKDRICLFQAAHYFYRPGEDPGPT